MPARPDLPTRSSFIKNNVKIIQHCEICKQSFDSHHPPACIQSKCFHVFGSTCLRRWLESDSQAANTCPTCREVLFRKMREPNFTGRPGQSNSAIWVENLGETVLRTSFADGLWSSLWKLYTLDEISDTDIEERINCALFEFAMDFETDEGIHLQSESWPAIRDIAKEMLRIHFQNGTFRGLDTASRDTVWLPQLEDALGWRTTGHTIIFPKSDTDTADMEED